MFRYAIDHGVNYIDSAYGYHGGKSEVTVGKALKDGYRQKVRVATKLPSWLVQSPQDYDRFLNEQLERLQTGKIDYYLLHGLSKERWAKLKNLKVLNWAEKAMSDGRIGGLGFSFHDDFSAFKEIIDAYDNWTLCQMQYNFMDVNYQAGNRGLKYAAYKNLAVIIMEPLRGGRLSRKPPESVTKLWASSPKKHTPAEWALLWVWNHPEVSVVLSGMSAMEQVVENVASADISGPGTLSPDDLALIDRVREAYRASSPIPCTSCRYCMPCPNGVEIPRIFEIYNDAIMYDDPATARFFYRGPNGLKEDQRADQCIECETCVEACPQNIQIPEWLKKVHELLGPAKKS
jgi:predicted aldo/keto reductase-like oxidoreductase